MRKLHSKLSSLRHDLRTWNWNVFGDINQKISELSKRIEATEDALQRNWNDDLNKDLGLLQSRLRSTLEDQHAFLEAKSHVKWIKDGDRNSKLFHAAARVRRSVNTIRVTLDDGTVTDDRDLVGARASSYFRDLLGEFSAIPSEDYFVDIQPSITDVDNEGLCRIPDKDEIRNAVRNLPKDSAPGPDGFNGSFFQSCWDFVGDDVSNAVIHFFKGFGLPPAMSSTVLTLIPKVKNAISMDQVRPISLCNFVHKIISRILNDRIRPLLGKVVGEEQFGFIPGRSIHQCIGLAHDLTSDINKKVHGGNIIAKLDMSKAYDRLSWVFLLRAMKSLGFSQNWCDLIYRNISNCWYSVRSRGRSYGYFKSNRGLRQGDPLSPTLFILAMEILSRKINKACGPGGGIMPYWSAIRAMEISHVFYADDILLFLNGGKPSVINMLKVLNSFCRNSGQVLQPSKCKLFLSRHISDSRRTELLRLTGYCVGCFPIRYLGAPLFSGQPRVSYFQGLVDAVKDRLEGWMKSFLSMAGRLTLIKSVLGSIPIHTLSGLPVPKGTLASIDRLLRSFLWSSGGSARHHWVSWNNVCSDMRSGGLGIRPLSHLMTALKGKMAWIYLNNTSLWAKHARSRFTINGRGSHLWRSIAPYISSIAHDCHWKIGNGETLAGVFCQGIAVSCPRKLRNTPIKDILSTPNLRREFMHNINPIIHNSLRDTDFVPDADKLIWNKDSFGVVSVKSFMRSFMAPVPVRREFEIIWESWIPPKVSCFLWRIMHRALPTNDNIVRVGISLASRCFCCDFPQCETMDHLFIQSDMAESLWGIICPVFRRQRPGSLKEFFHEWGVRADFNRFSNVFAFGLSCLCLWEMWKIRNAKIYDEGNSRFTMSSISFCAAALANIVPVKCRHDPLSRKICAFFGISPPLIQEFRVFWCPWRPFWCGNTCNIAIHFHDNRSKVAAIIRNSAGEFVFALKYTSAVKHFIKCLFHLMFELKDFAFSCIQSSQEEIFLLGRNFVVDWDLYQIKRKLVETINHSAVFKVCFSLNNPADVLSFVGQDSLRTSRIADLPLEVQRSILRDGLPHPCSSSSQQVFL